MSLPQSLKLGGGSDWWVGAYTSPCGLVGRGVGGCALIGSLLENYVFFEGGTVHPQKGCSISRRSKGYQAEKNH